ncbi:multidrug efflux SMR transporter [bacterium]|nr:multidrug efflux SMR transporter [bacterium]
MQWIYLLIASIFEVGWPLGLKIATNSQYRILWIIFAIIAMALSGIFLYLAQKQIPIGTAYAIWTGIGASCTFLIGVLVFHDILNLMRALGVILIIAGVVLLKLEA